MAKDNSSAKAARQAAAAARAAAESDLKARDRKIRLIGGAVVLLIMGALLAVPFIQGRSSDTAVDANAALPKGVTADTYGVKVGAAWTAADADSIPLVQVWEDFQCPACKSFEEASGDALVALANEGKVRLEFRPTIFLDVNLQAPNTAAGNPNSSLYASMAFGCAVDQDKAAEFHRAIFAAQPSEGRGYSVTDLVTIAQLAGVADIDTFTECVSSKKYEGWVNNSYDAFSKEGVNATPTVLLNGETLSPDVIRDPAALTAAITAAGETK